MARISSIRNPKTENTPRRATPMPKRGERSREQEPPEARPPPEHMAPGGEMAPTTSGDGSLGAALPGSRGLPPQVTETTPETIDSARRLEEQSSSGWGLVLLLTLIAIVVALIVYGVGY